MKSLIIREGRSLKSKSDYDHVTADVIFDSGAVGVIYCSRADANMRLFEISLIGKVVTTADLEKYKQLVRQSTYVELSYDEE